MQTTLYFSNQSLQILQGELKNGALVVSRYVTVPMEAGGLINGVVTNEEILLAALRRARDDFDVEFKNVSLVINTSLAVYKNLQVPKLKPAELLDVCRHEFEDSPNYDDLIMDYKGIAGKDGAVNMFAVAMERGVLDNYVHLFADAGIKLARIDTGLSGLVDYVGHTAEYATRTFSMYAVDGNNLLYALFENGRYVFSSFARIMAQRGSEAYAIEMAGKISSLAQFNKSQKSGYEMTTALFAGITDEEVKQIAGATEGTGITCALLPTTGNVVARHAMDDPFYLDEGIMPAAGSFEVKDAVNLMAAYKKAINPRRTIDIRNKKAILPIVLAGLFVVTLLGFFILNFLTQRDINELQNYINNSSNASSYAKAQDVENQLSNLQKQISAYDAASSAKATYPSFGSDKIAQVVTGGDGITATSMDIDMTTGTLKFTGTAGNEYQASTYVNNLITSGLFQTVEYQGYSYSAGSTVTTGTTTSTTPGTYNFTYTALLKGGVGQ